MGGRYRDRLGDVEADFPLFRSGVYAPTNLEYVGIGMQGRGDMLQPLVEFDVIAQFKPALGGSEVVYV